MERSSLLDQALLTLQALITQAWGAKVLLAVLVFLFGTWREAYAALAVLMLLDFITGVLAAKHQNKPVTSKTMGLKTGQKVWLYSVVLISANLADKGIPGPDFLLGLALAMLVVTEALSVVENMSRTFPDQPVLMRLRSALGSRLEDLKDKGGP